MTNCLARERPDRRGSGRLNIFGNHANTMQIPRIDAHQHFWQYDPTKHVWMNEDMAILKTDYLPVHLAPLLASCDMDGCVAVQANQAEIENDFLLELASQSDCIKGIVGWIDLCSEQVAERLEYYQQFPAIKGFRHIIHDEPALDFMLQPQFMKGVSALRAFGYTYDILIFAAHLPNTLTFVQKLSNQPFVIDHIAKPNIKTGEIESWKKQFSKVAAFENVYCKISGMVTEAAWSAWKQEDFTQYLDAVVECFGTNRIMYGSDWPVCTLAASYEAQYGIVKDYFSSFSKSEQDLFFGGNAIRFYNLNT
jgi:L-fuconolactonase